MEITQNLINSFLWSHDYTIQCQIRNNSLHSDITVIVAENRAIYSKAMSVFLYEETLTLMKNAKEIRTNGQCDTVTVFRYVSTDDNMPPITIICLGLENYSLDTVTNGSS